MHSLWILVVGFGCGCMSPLGWAWAGYESRSRTVWISTVFWGFMAWVVAGLAINTTVNDVPDGLGVAYPVTLLVVWFGGTIHALLLARHVLKAKLVHDEAAAQGEGFEAQR